MKTFYTPVLMGVDIGVQRVFVLLFSKEGDRYEKIYQCIYA